MSRYLWRPRSGRPVPASVTCGPSGHGFVALISEQASDEVSEGVSQRSCWDCGGPGAYTRLPHGRICTACRRRRHYHPEPCPICGTTRPLAYQLAEQNGQLDGQPAGAAIVCASCAGAESVFACGECGRENHPYGARRCARCILRERLTALLTDPASGHIHARLRPVFDELVGSERPQTGICCLRKKPGTGPRLLGQMARGEVAISHDTFRALPSDRAHNYLRDLLAALGVLAAYEPRIERMLPWLAAKLEPLPADQADLVRRFTHWHILRHLRNVAGQGRLTKAITDRAREQISAAIRLLAYLDEHGATAATATQELLERYQTTRRLTLSSEHAFITWLRTSRINTRLRIPLVPYGAPSVAVSDRERWAHVERLLHDDTLRGYTRIGGLFPLLFAQPLSRIVAMRTSQVTLAAERPGRRGLRHHRDADAGPGRPAHRRPPTTAGPEPLRRPRHRLAVPRRQARPPPGDREHPRAARRGWHQAV